MRPADPSLELLRRGVIRCRCNGPHCASCGSHFIKPQSSQDQYCSECIFWGQGVALDQRKVQTK